MFRRIEQNELSPQDIEKIKERIKDLKLIGLADTTKDGLRLFNIKELSNDFIEDHLSYPTGQLAQGQGDVLYIEFDDIKVFDEFCRATPLRLIVVPAIDVVSQLNVDILFDPQSEARTLSFPMNFSLN